MSSEPRSRRRWLQFSLRSMFVLALVVATFCAGLTYRREVLQRLRAELEQAKTETESANRRAASERRRGEMARIKAERRVLQAQIETFRSGCRAGQEILDAKLIEVRSLMIEIKNLRREIKETEAALRKTRNRFESIGGPLAPRLTPRSLWKDFQFHDGDGKPSVPGDDFPMPRPKPPSSFEFDQPLLGRTIA